MDCFLIPQARVINLFTGSSGDAVSLRACGSVGGKQLQELSRHRGAGGFSCSREQVIRQELAAGQKLL